MRLQALLVSALIALATPAFADPVTANDPNSLVKALQNAGYRALLDKDKDGDPKIATASGGNDIDIYFYGCTKNAACSYIEMAIVWKCEADMLDKCKTINSKWNTEERFIQSVMTNDNIGIYYFLDLDVGGMSSELFIDNIKVMSDSAAEMQKRFKS